MSNVIGLLIILLSDPKDDKIVFGVVEQFNSYSECVKILRDADLPHKDRMMCLPVVKPKEV